jgi:hypothetical protein
MTVCEDLVRKSALDDILVLRVSDSQQNVQPRCDTQRACPATALPCGLGQYRQ